MRIILSEKAFEEYIKYLAESEERRTSREKRLYKNAKDKIEITDEMLERLVSNGTWAKSLENGRIYKILNDACLSTQVGKPVVICALAYQDGSINSFVQVKPAEVFEPHYW